MEWWAWVLIGIGVVVIGYIKITVFKKMKEKSKKPKFTDED